MVQETLDSLPDDMLYFIHSFIISVIMAAIVVLSQVFRQEANLRPDIFCAIDIILKRERVKLCRILTEQIKWKYWRQLMESGELRTPGNQLAHQQIRHKRSTRKSPQKRLPNFSVPGSWQASCKPKQRGSGKANGQAFYPVHWLPL